MGIINYDSSALRVLVSVKGHPYERDQFFQVFESFHDMAHTAIEQPATAAFMQPDTAADWDVLCFYDMPGIDFSTQPPDLITPSHSLVRGFEALAESGKGMVFVHHALASWPLWPEFGEIIGGRFFYLPSEFRGEAVLDSGYRHNQPHRVSVLQPHHPVCMGVEPTFTLTDELYLCHAFEDNIIPLLASDYDFTWPNFSSARHAVTGRMHCNDDWPHPEGTSLVGWVKHYRNSPIVYLQPGDGPTAYSDPNYRRLLANALRWAASDAAHDWARQRHAEADDTALAS